MAGKYGPCDDWPVYWTCDVSTESPSVTGMAVTVATTILWGLTARQFGLCTVTLRPCRKSCYSGMWPWPFGEFRIPGMAGGGTMWPQPALIGGQWFNIVCNNGCDDGCSCSPLSEVYLPGSVDSVSEVKVDGVVLPSSGYRLDDSRKLVRIGAEWPYCNDLNRDDTEVDTWSVTAAYGIPPPDDAAPAVGELACEIIKAIKGEDCRLPKNVTQLARQGVTITMPDPTTIMQTGLTGLFLVDNFIRTWNPNGLKMRSRVINVDAPKPRRTDT